MLDVGKSLFYSVGRHRPKGYYYFRRAQSDVWCVVILRLKIWADGLPVQFTFQDSHRPSLRPRPGNTSHPPRFTRNKGVCKSNQLADVFDSVRKHTMCTERERERVRRCEHRRRTLHLPTPTSPKSNIRPRSPFPSARQSPTCSRPHLAAPPLPTLADQALAVLRSRPDRSGRASSH